MLKHQGIVYHSCLPQQLICTSASAPAVSSMNRAVVCTALAFSSMFLTIWGLQSLVSLNTSLISLSTSDFEYQQLSLSKGSLLAFHRDLVQRLLYFTTSWHIAACSWCKQQASSASAFCEWNDFGSDLVWYYLCRRAESKCITHAEDVGHVVTLVWGGQWVPEQQNTSSNSTQR